ncbi:8895_t:CDS:10 [Acaulospora morrowiae]|uniref:2-amino-3-carboxymuconate-6-semialdehyde decarboxylase n=1 Tax=Acaulospora morrowiae TaxID=94023 RepID=A0A9N8V3U1_9GLOM|nr:8895_t:CDS:10 [Acaulospora morrowiae]
MASPDKDTPEKDIVAAHEPTYPAHRDQFPALLPSSVGSGGRPPPSQIKRSKNIPLLQSSIQSNYEKIVKYIILSYIILELLFRVLTVYHVQDFVKSDLGFLEGISVILCKPFHSLRTFLPTAYALINLNIKNVVKKEGYFLFGKYILTTTQIATLANTSESLVFIMLSLFVIHLWFILKESNPIFNTEERSRKIEISLAVPVILLALARCFEYQPKPSLGTANVISERNTDNVSVNVTNIESEEAIRAEEREMRRVESENKRYFKCLYGCCDGCCGYVAKNLRACYRLKCDFGIFDCDGFIAGCFGSFLNMFARCRRRADENPILNANRFVKSHPTRTKPLIHKIGQNVEDTTKVSFMRGAFKLREACQVSFFYILIQLEDNAMTIVTTTAKADVITAAQNVPCSDGTTLTKTSGRKFFKIDMHTHILPKHLPDMEKKCGYGGWIKLNHNEEGKANMLLDGKNFREVKCNCWSVNERVHECNVTGVDVQVLSTVPVMFAYFGKPQHTLELARYLNDHIAQVCSENPRRFVGLGTVPMQSPDLAVQELKRCVNELGLCGVQIGSHINEWNLDAPELNPFWEACENLNAAVFVHPWDMENKGRMEKYWYPWLIGMPCETTISICSVIFGGVLERYPKLKISFAHGGGSFFGTLGRIVHGFEVRPDLCAIKIKKSPLEYLKRIYVDSLVHDEDALQIIIKKIGAGQIMLGSDYPFPLGEHHPGEMIERCEWLSDEDKERLLGKNALKFLGIENHKFYGFNK